MRSEVDEQRVLLLSLKPAYAEAILAGRKTVELRRSRPRLSAPTRALLYASGPEMSLVGICTVTEVFEQALAELWRTVRRHADVKRGVFDEYFQGCTTGSGLRLTDPERLLRKVPLAQLRHAAAGFHPPQSYRYLPATSAPVLFTGMTFD